MKNNLSFGPSDITRYKTLIKDKRVKIAHNLGLIAKYKRKIAWIKKWRAEN